jgi:hypothetical protein
VNAANKVLQLHLINSEGSTFSIEMHSIRGESEKCASAEVSKQQIDVNWTNGCIYEQYG